ncbi:MAG: CDP-alcohol phosphatidyltransferase family protein [Bacteroidales bacterium]|nr:CDP-alcohol phosphatidyltransferase family protein [Bacteroidales bacterium]
MRKSIPNLLTCLNLLSGTLGIIILLTSLGVGSTTNTLVARLQSLPIDAAHLAFICVCCSAVFDFFDGFVARLLGVTSPVGKELDSLADLVSFGILPTTAAFCMVSNQLEAVTSADTLRLIVELLVWVMVAFSALRLAKFNVDTRQSTSFIGLATPANALFWIGLFCSGCFHNIPWWLLFAGVLMSCYLLVCELPMFSFKIRSLKWTDAKFQILLAAGALVLIPIFGYLGLSLVVLWYLLLSLVKYFVDKAA